MRLSVLCQSLLLAIVVSTMGAAGGLAQGRRADWKPVDPANLALKTPKVEKDADAEAIFWKVRIDNQAKGIAKTVLAHYVRIKIFTQRGVESQSTVDLTSFGKGAVREVRGRTIRPNGSILELSEDAVFERTLVKARGLSLKAKSFAMPGVEPGAIIEYQWREVRRHSADHMPLSFQRDIPIWLVTYYIKPNKRLHSTYPMRARAFQCPPMSQHTGSNGFSRTTAANVPAFQAEPFMPPENQVRSWVLIYHPQPLYLESGPLPLLERPFYWRTLGRIVYEEFRRDMKVKGPMKKAAAAIVGDASTPDEKLERLYRYCRSAIRNIQHDSSEMTADAREAVKRNKKPADTLTRGVGTGYDINMLFAALATAAGFDARWAMLADRGTIFFDSNFADPYFLNSYNVAVRVGDGWRFFDPSQPYLPSGMLRWQEEGVDALISDPVNGLFVRTPLSRSRQSVTKRRATLRLGEDGTLEGKVRIEFSGHSGIAMRERYGSHSPEQREDSLREGVKKRLSSAELESVKVENATDPDKAFAYEYDVRVPGYAQRTGKRLFLQPAFFQRSKEPVFQTSERKHDINFPHPWSEQDTVTIELPLGYELENAESPGGGGPEGMYDARLQLADERTLIYKRSVRFGDNSRILFPAAEYPVLKQQFDLMHKLDNHTVSLKQSESAVRN